MQYGLHITHMKKKIVKKSRVTKTKKAVKKVKKGKAKKSR